MNPVIHRLGSLWHRFRLRRCEGIRLRLFELLGLSELENEKSKASSNPEEAFRRLREAKRLLKEAKKVGTRMERIIQNAHTFFSKCPHCRGQVEAIQRRIAFRKAMGSSSEMPKK